MSRVLFLLWITPTDNTSRYLSSSGPVESRMASIFDTPPPPVFTRDGRDGFPPEPEFEAIMAEYIDGLNPRKRDKALMTQAMYDTILVILTNPHDTRCATAQFRFWTKKMFRLVTTAHAQIVTHENRPVAVKEQIYDVLVQCHSQCSHGGRDKTSNQVRRYYSWIPKELIARFVKACPLCNARRSAKSGGSNAGLAALTALGADTSLLLASGGMIDDSSPPSESSTSSDSAVTTPSRQTRALGMPNSHGMPFTPGSYLASAMYHHMPMSAASNASSLPPMPSPSHNPQDWTQWVNNTPQRVALSQSVGSNGSATHDSGPGSANPTLHFTYHTSDSLQCDNLGNIHSISLQTPPQARSPANNTAQHQNQQQRPQQEPQQLQQGLDALPSACSTTGSYAPPSAPSAETQAYYSHLMQQTMASFLQAPPMTSQWSSDSVTTVSSATSASSRSSVELEDLTDSAANSPLPPLPSDTNKDAASAALQQQIDSITAHLGGVTAQSLEDEEEASFQSFMSSFSYPQVEQDQIDPLLRAMNLDVMQGMPLLGETMPTIIAPDHLPKSDSPKLASQTVQKPASKSQKTAPSPLGGNTFKFPPAPATKSDAKKIDKKNSKSGGRNAGKIKSSSKEPKGTNTQASTKQAQPVDSNGSSHSHSAAPVISTPDLTSYFQLQNTFNQMREGLVSGGNTPAMDNNSTCMTNQAHASASTAAEWQARGPDNISQSLASFAQAEFSFHVSDMSGDDLAANAGNNTFNSSTTTQTTNAPRGIDDGKGRPRPPQLDFSAFSNNNAFSPAEYVSSEQDLHMPDHNTYLTAYQYPSEFNQSTSGSVSAPAHITQFTQPEVPIITPNAPLFNYEQQMQMNFGFSGNSFVDYSGMDLGQYGLQSAATPDLNYDYTGNTGTQTLQMQAQEALRPASAGGYLEPNAYGSPQKGVTQQQQQHMAIMPAIHSAPFYHLPMSSQQQQAQARELSEQIQAILDGAVPTNEALVEQATGMCHTRPSRKR